MLSILFLGGCTSTRKHTAVPVDVPKAFSTSGLITLSGSWWHVFEDAELNATVENALSSNLELEAAWERLRAARAVIKREKGGHVPDLEASLSSGITAPRFGDDETIDLGLRSQYEIDLWGRIRSQVEAERFRASASLFDYRATALTLSAEVVMTWYQLTETLAQQDLLEEQLHANEQIYEIIENRLGAGQIRGVDLLRQRQLIEATKEQKIVAESAARVLEHRLAVLMGKPPQTRLTFTQAPIPLLPPLPETGVPSALIKRRPDIQSAYYHLLAADQDLAVAVSNQFPRFTLTANAAVMTGSTKNLVRDWLASIAANLLIPIFKGRSLKAEVARTEAVKRERVYAYGQAILTAFQEVEDALIQEAKQKKRVRSISSQIQIWEQTQEQLRFEFFNGFGDYLDVLLALSDEQRLQRERLSAQMQLVAHRIALYRSLAGNITTVRETQAEK